MCYNVDTGPRPGEGRPKGPMTTGCLYCDEEGGRRLWRDARCRVVLTDEPFPGFCRVIWTAHTREMTDLSAANRGHLMHIVYAVESALRARLNHQ